MKYVSRGSTLYVIIETFIIYTSLPPYIPPSLSLFPSLPPSPPSSSLPPSLSLPSLPASQSDKILRVTHSLSGCGGCKRLTGENTFVISVALDNTQPLLLSTTTEDDLIQWQQALCEVTLDRDKPSSDQRRNAMCTVLLTHEKVCTVT